MPAEQLLQQPLALAVPELHPQRHRPGELDDAMIEHRHSRLEADAHGGAVDLDQDVVGQVGRSVREHHRLVEIDCPQGPESRPIDAPARLCRRLPSTIPRAAGSSITAS